VTALPAYPAEVVHGTFFEHDVPLSSLFVHFRHEPGGYARPLNQTRVKRLVETWDDQAVGPLLLSMRPDDRYAVIDGHHRMQAAMQKGITALDALVYIDLTLADEARLYRKFGDYLKQTPLDKYHAGIAEGMPEYLAIQRTLQAHNLHVPVNLGTTNDTVDAVDALIRVSRDLGLHILNDTLGLLRSAWGGEHRAYRSSIVMGLAHFLARYQQAPNYNQLRLIRHMRETGMAEIEVKARAIHAAQGPNTISMAWGQAFLYFHDLRVREENKLGAWTRKFIHPAQTQAWRANLRNVTAQETPDARKARSAKSAETQKARRASGLLYTANKLPCPYCYVEAGKPCLNAQDKPLTSFHKARFKAAEDALKP